MVYVLQACVELFFGGREGGREGEREGNHVFVFAGLEGIVFRSAGVCFW